MNRKLYFLIFFVSLCSIFVSCSEGEVTGNEGESGNVNIINNKFDLSLTSPADAENVGFQAFSNNAKASVYSYQLKDAVDVNTEVVYQDTVFNMENVLITFTGNKWISDQTFEWPNANGWHYFIAVYPGQEKKIEDLSRFNYSISVDDTAPLMIGWLRHRSYDEPSVKIPMKFMAGRLKLNVFVGNQYMPNQKNISVSSVAIKCKNSAVYNCFNSTFELSKDDIILNLKSEESVNGLYSFVGTLIEQELPGVNISISINTEDGLKTETIADKITVTNGKITTVDLVLGENKFVTANVKVEDWIPGEVGEGKIEQL